MNKKLLAPCGINCAICQGYLREKNTCPGCRYNIPKESKKSQHRLSCVIKKCKHLAKTKSGFCYECEIYPCARMKRLIKRYKERYDYDIEKTFATIRKKGVSEILAQHKNKYSCPGGTVCVHDGKCYEKKKSNNT